MIEFIKVSKKFKYKDFQDITLKEFILKRRQQNNNNSKIALKDISFKLDKGKCLGIIGRNGSGKTTLLRLLARIYAPDEGKIIISGKVCPLIDLLAGFSPEFKIKENIYLNACLLGWGNEQIKRKINDIIEFAELNNYTNMPLKYFSSGMLLRLGFAIAAHTEADIYIFDEVITVGDAFFQKKCYDFIVQLKKTQKTIVIASHNMDLINTFCDKVILLENGKILDYSDAPNIIEKYSKLE